MGTDVAAEIVSETFLVAWRKFADIPESPLPWLYRVASFEISNHRRRQERAEQLHVAMEHLQRNARSTDSSGDLSELVAGAFDSLSPGDQEILRLATWEGLSLVEGASVLGCSVSAYRMRLHRARLRLGKRVSQEQADARSAVVGPTFPNPGSETRGFRVQGAEVAL